MASFSNNGTGWEYDVFLNFRGADTRNNFTSHLHHALSNKGIHTFIDYQLERGKVISPALLEVIESSRISILVFSPDYASSTYCLDELAKVLQCHQLNGQIVVPVFYKVTPNEVETQTGTYGKAFTTHESMEDTAKVKDWRSALSKATSFAGWPLNNGNEADLIQLIVAEICNKLNKKFLHVADYPVGLDYHMRVMNHMLNVDSNDVRMVGIYGTGGIGKTTIAKAIFNRFCYQFDGSCFLPNVRGASKEHSTVAKLQEKLFFEILRDKIELMGNCDLGITLLKRSLCCKRVLIVIDDVDDVDQLKKLAGAEDWFASGSRIIITTRDKHLLVSNGVQVVHNVKGLRDKEALKLLSWNAFKKSQPEENYAKLSHCMLKYAGGLPLALVVLGSDLCGKSISEWESYLRKLKRIPNAKIFDILKISFDGLEEDVKAIFLDIAFFFKGSHKNYATEVLKACNLEPDWGISVLKEKSLISSEYGELQMHELMQSMGREIVHQESPKFPGKRSRLWRHEDVLDVLTEDMGTHEIEAIMLDLPQGYGEVDLPAEAFAKMKALRMLIIRNAHITGGVRPLPNGLRWLEWDGCPSESFPLMFGARQLTGIKMSNGLFKQLGVGLKNFTNLASMDFKCCTSLTEIPDLSTIPSLEKMSFVGCKSLVKVHPSIGCLKKLKFLCFWDCTNLESLPAYLELPSLEELDVKRTKLAKLPIFKNLKKLKDLAFGGCRSLTETPDCSAAPSLEWLQFDWCTSLANVHPSIGFLEKLQCLSFSQCSNLRSLPSSFKLRSLKYFSFEDCTNLEELPTSMEYMTSLEELNLCGIAIKELPSSIEFLPRLFCLTLRNCKNLASLPSSIYKFPSLRTLRLIDCTQLSKFPENTTIPRQSTGSSSHLSRLSIINCNLSDLEFLNSAYFSKLKELDLSGSNNFISMPSWISKLAQLFKLSLNECQRLLEIPKLPRSIVKVVARDCKSLERFPQLADIFQCRLDNVQLLDFSNCHKLADSQGKNFEIRPCFHNRTYVRELDAFFPGSEIPPWFEYTSEGNPFSFQLPPREQIKSIVLCLIIASDAVASSVSAKLYMDSRVQVSSSAGPDKIQQRFAFESDHMYFFTVPIDPDREDEDDCGFTDLFFPYVSVETYGTVKKCGAYVVLKSNDDSDYQSALSDQSESEWETTSEDWI